MQPISFKPLLWRYDKLNQCGQDLESGKVPAD